jgi:hypothetical protein
LSRVSAWSAEAATPQKEVAEKKQEAARFADHGVVFDYPKGWKIVTKINKDIATVSVSDAARGTMADVQIHPAGVDPKGLRDLMDKSFQDGFGGGGKVIKGSVKSVKRRLAGSVQDGAASSYDLGKGVVMNLEIYAFPLPSKKKVVCVILGYFSLYAESAQKELDLFAASFAEGTSAASAAPIAQAGFNKTGDAGWATAWGPASPGTVIQKKVVFEGDGALHLSNAGIMRRLADAQQGRFVVEQHVQVPRDGGMIAYIRNGDGRNADGPVWRAANGKFFALLEDGKWLDTSFASEPGKWHKVVVTVEVSARTWKFSVDDRLLKSPEPLPFRHKVDRLDTVHYLCENVPGIYIDAVRVLRTPGP